MADATDPHEAPSDELQTFLGTLPPSGVSIRLYRSGAGGREVFVGSVPADADPGDIRRAWGGGRYRARALRASKFVGGATFELEGDPISRRASTLGDALREAERCEREAARTETEESAPPPAPLPVSGAVDASTLMVEMLRILNAQQAASMQRLEAQQTESRELLMEMLRDRSRGDDPYAQIERILSLRDLISPPPQSSGAAIMQALPQMEGLIDRIMSRLDRPTKSPFLGAGGGAASPPPASTSPGPAPAAAPAAAPAESDAASRLRLALDAVRASLRGDCDPDALAEVVASIAGDEVAGALGADEHAVDQIIGAYPDLATARERLSELHQRIGAMYEPDRDAPNGSDADGVRAAGVAPGDEPGAR